MGHRYMKPIEQQTATKQDRFISLVAEGLDPEAAAIRAGYSKNRAARTSVSLLQRPAVQQRLEALQIETDKNSVASREEVLRFYTRGLRVPAEALDAEGKPLAEYADLFQVECRAGRITYLPISKAECARALRQMLGYDEETEGASAMAGVKVNINLPDNGRDRPIDFEIEDEPKPKTETQNVHPPT